MNWQSSPAICHQLRETYHTYWAFQCSEIWQVSPMRVSSLALNVLGVYSKFQPRSLRFYLFFSFSSLTFSLMPYNINAAYMTAPHSQQWRSTHHYVFLNKPCRIRSWHLACHLFYLQYFLSPKVLYLSFFKITLWGYTCSEKPVMFWQP